MIIYYSAGKALRSVPVTHEQTMFLRDRLPGELAHPGEVYFAQFWGGTEGGNFFLMRSLDDRQIMEGIAAKAKSTFQIMSGDPSNFDVPK